MKFQRYLYNIELYNASVAKYQDGKQVVLIAETDMESNPAYEQKVFDNRAAYLKWIDNIIGNRNDQENEAAIFQDILDNMRISVGCYE